MPNSARIRGVTPISRERRTDEAEERYEELSHRYDELLEKSTQPDPPHGDGQHPKTS
ncbi:hypothetical protein OIB37_34315 [Streptomyces sp. NBC_00820]|uniref:hypothetical protein n=1 Tax=Streptomyces sp. NBC_00820 TaxID=2975842 RepID=UPI002ED54904|nr:hypothetical protein OIB37_34315 [Streptomyces sp. NBC_00820]